MAGIHMDFPWIGKCAGKFAKRSEKAEIGTGIRLGTCGTVQDPVGERATEYLPWRFFPVFAFIDRLGRIIVVTIHVDRPHPVPSYPGAFPKTVPYAEGPMANVARMEGPCRGFSMESGEFPERLLPLPATRCWNGSRRRVHYRGPRAGSPHEGKGAASTSGRRHAGSQVRLEPALHPRRIQPTEGT